VSWDLLPAQIVDATWVLGVIMDDREEWVGQGEELHTVVEEAESLSLPLD
jgi:hypothetical protein